ncbi:MAG: TonB-dependent receptor, partial [Bacteroidota bacterium]
MASKNKLFSVHAIIRLLLLLCVSGNLLAQNKLPDIELDPVEITENRISPFAIGAHTTAFDSTLSNLKAGNNVADLVANYTAISLKSYGNGMLSTISMRGTGPEHTAVLWHGINISYPMLGQSDLSVLSLAFADKIIIQHGANSALYGSGAIGGTVSLENLEPVKGVNLSLSQWFGSFGTLSNNLKASFNTDKYFIKINTLWNQSENNFAFKNTTKVGIPVEKQNGANYNILGTSVDAGLRLSKGKMLMLSGQYFNADRNIQPSMNANTSGDNQMDENIRVRVGYSHQKVKSEWELSYAYLHDVIGFNGEETIADQHIVRSKFTHQLLNKIKLNAGIDYNRINIQAKFYIDEGKLENRANLWSSVLFNPIPRFLLSINLRQSFNPDYKIPFTQSIGAEYLLVNSAKHQLRLKGLFSEGYRVP